MNATHCKKYGLRQLMLLCVAKTANGDESHQCSALRLHWRAGAAVARLSSVGALRLALARCGSGSWL